MDRPVLIQIVGTPVACAAGVKDTWRQLARWLAAQTSARFGDAVQVHYHDLFDPRCPPLPPQAQLPLVLINGQVFSTGRKVNLSAIHAHLEKLGLKPSGR